MGTNVHGDGACAEGQLGAQVQLKDEGRSRLASLCLPPAAMLELTAAPGRQGGVAARVGASDRCRPAAVGGTLCLVSESSLSKNEKHFFK